MVEILLIVIIAILAFGGGAFLSAVAGIFGMAIAVVAFIAICFWLGFDPAIAIIVSVATSLVGLACFRIYQWDALRKFQSLLESKGVPNAEALVEKIRRRRSLSDEQLDRAQLSFAKLTVRKHIPDKSPVDWLYREWMDRRISNPSK